MMSRMVDNRIETTSWSQNISITSFYNNIFTFRHIKRNSVYMFEMKSFYETLNYTDVGITLLFIYDFSFLRKHRFNIWIIKDVESIFFCRISDEIILKLNNYIW